MPEQSFLLAEKAAFHSISVNGLSNHQFKLDRIKPKAR
jgi:hypothetical protein